MKILLLIVSIASITLTSCTVVPTENGRPISGHGGGRSYHPQGGGGEFCPDEAPKGYVSRGPAPRMQRPMPMHYSNGPVRRVSGGHYREDGRSGILPAKDYDRNAPTSSPPELVGFHLVKRNKRTNEIIQDFGVVNPNDPRVSPSNPKTRIRGADEAVFLKNGRLHGTAPTHLSNKQMEAILRSRAAGQSRPSQGRSVPTSSLNPSKGEVNPADFDGLESEAPLSLPSNADSGLGKLDSPCVEGANPPPGILASSDDPGLGQVN